MTFGCCIAPDAGAQASAEPIQTDRPDFVESSNVVGTGRIQIETSLAWEKTAAGGTVDKAWTMPTLLRIGTGQDWEVRLETDGYTRFTARDVATGQRSAGQGFADLSIGAKWHLRDQSGATPSMALLMHADLATGSAQLRGNDIRPSARLVAEWELPSDFSLGVMPGIAFEKSADGRRFYQGIWGVVVGKAWTERFRTFVEFAAPAIARSRHGVSFSTYNAGAAFLLDENCQLDILVQQGATRNAPDRALSLGFSRRF